LSGLTRKYVTVILSGEGADELLAGYDKYKFLLYAEKFCPAFCSPLFKFLSNGFQDNIKMQRGLNLLSSKGRAEAAYLDFASVFTGQEKQKLFGRELKVLEGELQEPANLVAKYLGAGARGKDFLDRLLALDIETWLPNDVLLKNDKMTMAHSLEARVPFLDHKFAEQMMLIPNRLKLKGLKEKYILRKAMDGLIPKQIISRRKHGFTVPIHDWVKDGLGEYVDTLLNKERINDFGFWNYSYIEQLVSRNLNNEFYKRQFWAIMTFEIWHQIFIENDR
jgi:asparagine synthase (glutamine-hydrolysing)